MAYYETIMILNPTQEEKQLKKQIHDYEEYLQKFSKEKRVEINEIGEKKLAYMREGHSMGYYVQIQWQGNHENVSDLEGKMKADDNVLKYLTVKFDDENEIKLKDLDTSEKTEQVKPIVDVFDIIFGNSN